MKFSLTPFILFVVLFIIEVCIASFLESGFIRHTFGDYLVVIMIYCLFRSLLKIKPIVIAILVLSISVIIEFLQLTSFLKLLHLDNSAMAKIVFGSTFHYSDLIAYTLGVITALLVDYGINKSV